MKIKQVLLTWAVVCTALSGVASAETQQRPNVLFILVDDLGWADVGYNGSKVYETPQIDRLARQGMVLTDFYSAGPVCSPTRASIMTGKAPGPDRTDKVALYSGKRFRRSLRTTCRWRSSRLPRHSARKVTQRGISSAKWHLGYKEKHWAAHQGFEDREGRD